MKEESDYVTYDRSRRGLAWVSYFDLLGMKQAFKHKHPLEIWRLYQKCLKRLKHCKEGSKTGGFSNLQFVHFSDSFIIYTPPLDDPLDRVSFGEIEQASRSFIETLLEKQIPARGALSCGEFYADESGRIFFGAALAFASEFAEDCNWIGFALHPSAVCRMRKEGCPVETHCPYSDYYKPWAVPAKKPPMGADGTGQYFAYLLGACSNQSGQKRLLGNLKEMENDAEDSAKAKYRHTRSFIEHYLHLTEPAS